MPTYSSLRPDASSPPSYAHLTAARPFDYFTAWNMSAPSSQSIQFGIATDDVIAVSLVGQDNSATPAGVA